MHLTVDVTIEAKNILCAICGKEISSVKECAWTSCPILWNESRIDIIGSNGNDGLAY